MSLQVHELTPNAKLLTGCGDGVRNEPPKGAIIRTPVPSCRRFATRPPPTHRSDVDVKVRLQTAIQELATHPNITRRRALTMAEINPTRRLSTTMDGLHLSSPAAKGAGRMNTTLVAATAAPPRDEDAAGRRVYQVLLLNVWRRRRTQVATLTDSLGALETQNGKLEMQIDALRRLRQAESNKRTAAVTENQHLHVQIQDTLQENENFKTENIGLEKQVKMLEQKERLLQLEAQNAKNDWMTVRCELRSTENQLGAERAKIKKLRDEKLSLLDKLSQKEQDFQNLSEQIDELQERLLSTEVNLQDTILSNNNYEDNMKALREKINVEAEENAELQKKILELTVGKEKLKTKLQDLRINANSNREFTKKLGEENQRLKKDVTAIKEDLKREQERPWWKNAGELALAPLSALQTARKNANSNREFTKKLEEEKQRLKKDVIAIKEDLKGEQERPWWKNAGELALAPLNALQNVAYIMLPAIPNTITRATSTTDLPTRS